MTSKTFVSGTVIDSAWLNDVNDNTYGPTAPTGTLRGDLSASSGASLVGANAYQTQNEVNLEHVSVMRFGAVGDGIADDTAAIQAAINYGGKIFFPSGTYNIYGLSTSGTTAISLKSNIEIFGEGASSIIRQMGDTLNGFHANENNGGTTSVSDNIKNIYIHDLSFTMETTSFRESQHSINLSAVSDFLIERCRFVGWRGDAIYVGSGVGVERHNERVSITNCYFDGVNKTNRNCISVIDGTDILIDGNYFTRCSTSTMPGAVDIEPNVNIYHIVRNITVSNNRFYDIGGDSGVICFAIPGLSYTVMPHSFKVLNNTIDTFGVNRGVYFRYTDPALITDSIAPFDILVQGNSISNGKYPIVFGNTKDLKIIGNTFSNTEAMLSSYYTLTDVNQDTVISHNNFINCGKSITDVNANYGLVVSNMKRFELSFNTFNDCGRSTGGNGTSVLFNDGNSSGVKLMGNTFASPNGKTSIGVQKSASHTFIPSSNYDANNLFLNSLTSYFQSNALSSWTPVVLGGTTAGTCTYTSNTARLHVENGVLHYALEVTWTGHTGTGQLYISLPSPFGADEPTYGLASSLLSGITLAAGEQAYCLQGKAGQRLQFYKSNLGSVTSLTIPAAGTAYVTGSYSLF